MSWDGLAQSMSKATKIVAGTIGVSGLFAIALILLIVFA